MIADQLDQMHITSSATRRTAATFILAGTCLVTGCTARDPARSSPAAPRHVLIVTIDTLRADHLGCYGNRDVATPNIDRLANEGVLADQAVVQAPITRPSHMSIFT